MSRGRVWATTGFVLGVAVSVAGNVAHTAYPSASALAAAGKTVDTWEAPLGARLFAAFWPVALLITVEVLARVDWPRTWGWSLARFGGASLVAAVAAIMSYAHLNGLLRAYGEDDTTSRIGPLCVDGLMVVCGFALLAIGRHGTAQAPEEASAAAPERLDWVPLPAFRPPAEVPVPARVPALEVRVPEPDELQAKAAREFADDIEAGRVPGVKRIKKRLNVGQDRAKQVQGYLGVLAERPGASGAPLESGEVTPGYVKR